MSDLDTLDLGPIAPPTLTGARGRRCTRHRWTVARIIGSTLIVSECSRCGKPWDETRARRGTSARRLGGDTERRIERTYGPRKVGEYGDAIDLLGRDFAWQSKASRSAPPAWLTTTEGVAYRGVIPAAWASCFDAMEPIRGHRLPLLVISHVRHGARTRDWIIVRAADWAGLHGPPATSRWAVMSGETFLDIHGTDEEGA
jgi:hypothetical protein